MSNSGANFSTPTVEEGQVGNVTLHKPRGGLSSSSNDSYHLFICETRELKRLNHLYTDKRRGNTKTQTKMLQSISMLCTEIDLLIVWVQGLLYVISPHVLWFNLCINVLLVALISRDLIVLLSHSVIVVNPTFIRYVITQLSCWWHALTCASCNPVATQCALKLMPSAFWNATGELIFIYFVSCWLRRQLSSAIITLCSHVCMMCFESVAAPPFTGWRNVSTEDDAGNYCRLCSNT